MSPSVRELMRADDRLDDVGRARIWSEVQDRLATASPRARRVPVVALAIGAAAVAIAAAVAVLVMSGLSSSTSSSGFPERGRLTAPAASTLTTSIGHARVALVGPAAVDVLHAEDAGAVRLTHGTLLVEFEGGPGRSLRIEAPGLTVDVVGTLFAVEAGTPSCVSVREGRVRVTTASGNRVVDAGGRACSDGTTTEVPEATREALDRHTAQLARVNPTAPEPAPVPASPAAAPVPAPARLAPVATPQPQRPPQPQPHAAAGTAAGTAAAAATDPAAAAAAEPVPAPATVSPPPPTDAELYKTAEAALARKDAQAADAALATLIASHPLSSLLDQALYERARLAYARRAWTAARRYLDQLAAVPRTALAEPGRYLGCRIAVEAADADAARCLADYRATYPRSPHDLEVLGLLAKLAHTSGGCTAAERHITELARIYGRTDLARAWRERCPAGTK